VSPFSPKGPFHVVENNDFTESAQRVQRAKKNPLTSDSSRPSREPLHDRISAEDHCTGRARFEANDFLSYPRPRSPTHELVNLY